MRRIDAEIYFPAERQHSTVVFVSDDATDEDIREAIFDEALSMIDIEYVEHE